MRRDDGACVVAVRRVPPIGVDAERLDVDAALVHGREPFGPEHERRRRDARRVDARHAARDLGKHAMRVHVDDLDAAAADVISFRAGVGCAWAPNAATLKAAPVRPQELPAIRHEPFPLFARGLRRASYVTPSRAAADRRTPHLAPRACARAAQCSRSSSMPSAPPPRGRGTACVRVLNTSELEVFLPVRTLLVERRRAEAHLDPLHHAVRANSRVGHVAQVFTFGNRAAPQGPAADRGEERALPAVS